MFWFAFSWSFRHYICVSIDINKINRFNRIRRIWGFFSIISWFCIPRHSHGVLFSRLHCVFWCQGNKTNGKNLFTCTTPAFISSMFRQKRQRWEGTQQTRLKSNKSNYMSMWGNLRIPSKEGWHLFPFYLNKLVCLDWLEWIFQ